MLKISNSTIKSISKKNISVPMYNRSKLKLRYAHIGLSNFHKSHFLTYMDLLLNKGIDDGGVFEIDIIPANKDIINGLKKQDYMYSLLNFSPKGKEECRINGAILGYANQLEEPQTVLSVLSNPEIQLISMTITEKGYYYLDDEKSLDFENPMIKHDLETDEPAKSAIGCISEALRNRYNSNSPVTILSCDNIPENGKVLKTCILQFCNIKYPEIVHWIESFIAFPCTMVDRITPATTQKDIEYIADKYNIDDKCPIHSESFSQWIIENSTASKIPAFGKAGALIVKDVKPYELMKIRLLNGAHSALSYPAYMMGIEKVHTAVQNPLIGRFIRNCYMEDITKTLPIIDEINLDEYKDNLIERFSNPYIEDKILRLASDGSKKIANAIIRPLEEALTQNVNVDSLILSLALWQYFFIIKDVNGNNMPIEDPKKDSLLQAANDSKEFLMIAGLSKQFLSNKRLFSRMSYFLMQIKEIGIASTLENFINENKKKKEFAKIDI